MTSDPDQVGIGSSFRLGRQVQQFSIMQVMQVISFRLCRYSSFRLRRWLQQFLIRFRSFRLVGIVPPLIDFKFIDIQRTKFHVFSAMGGERDGRNETIPTKATRRDSINNINYKIGKRKSLPNTRRSHEQGFCQDRLPTKVEIRSPFTLCLGYTIGHSISASEIE